MLTKKVLVTGAGGRTGNLVLQRLAKPGLAPVAGVRSKQSRDDLIEKHKLDAEHVKVVDINLPREQAYDQLKAALAGCYGLIIATSAVPVPIPPPEGAPPGPPKFVWKEGQAPEQVDWLGQQVQIDAAKDAGVEHVVIISSMGGTNPNHPLNMIGQPNGNILQWKRKAEQYLIASGLKYTIIHPGGLIDQPGGERRLRVGVDDALATEALRSIPRADVAEVSVQSLLHSAYVNRSFDLTSYSPGDGAPTTDFGSLLDSLEGKNCDYSINSQM